MFSKKMVLIVGVLILITVNVILLSFSSKSQSTFGLGRVGLSLVSPFQELVTRSIRFARDIWEHYFFLVTVAHENENLKKSLNQFVGKSNQWHEIDLANSRLRNLLNFQKAPTHKVVAAEVIGKDPSGWFKTIIIDKGKSDGLKKGLAVVLPTGIVGQVIEAAGHYSKVMLVIDRNSAVDAMVQRSRARGIIKGESADQCRFEFVLRKHDVQIDDTVIASGLDGVYPKGLRIGRVADISQRNADIFYEITVAPFVDYEKLEEVLVILPPQAQDVASQP
ncbi:MAG: rod shape-determining protein MreC [Deltaproteobacteria bacterium]|jgi:rod shape-determining protein MreC|nr:rod shape-determining protein MreC [Deltaproteobacteria bacterium]